MIQTNGFRVIAVGSWDEKISIFFLLTLWFREIFKLPSVMRVGEMGVWWICPGQQLAMFYFTATPYPFIGPIIELVPS